MSHLPRLVDWTFPQPVSHLPRLVDLTCPQAASHSPKLVDSGRFRLCCERPKDCLGEAEMDTWEGARLQPLP